MGCTSSKQAAGNIGGLEPVAPRLPDAPAAAPAPVAPPPAQSAEQGNGQGSSNGQQAPLERSQSRMPQDVAKKWLLVKERKPGAKARMILLGWAGSSSTAFGTWQMKNAELVAVELPARNARLQERGLSDVLLIARRIAEAMDVLGFLKSKIPLVIFGHSFGAMLSLEITKELKRTYDFVPRQLIFAGCRPLHCWGVTNYYRENDEEMIESLIYMGGLTKEMGRDKALMERVLPAIKADHLAMDRYVLDEAAEPVDAPILYLSGDKDPRAPLAQAPGWQQYTKHPLVVKEFRGEHFFIKDSQADVLHFLTRTVAAL